MNTKTIKSTLKLIAIGSILATIILLYLPKRDFPSVLVWLGFLAVFDILVEFYVFRANKTFSPLKAFLAAMVKSFTSYSLFLIVYVGWLYIIKYDFFENGTSLFLSGLEVILVILVPLIGIAAFFLLLKTLKINFDFSRPILLFWGGIPAILLLTSFFMSLFIFYYR